MENDGRKIELLSPAGGMGVLDAAFASGADAVYLGMKHFNARAGARNFSPAELNIAVKKAHEAGGRVYLTLNTMIAQRELGMAARSLAAARDAGVDGVLIMDPAYLAFRKAFPELDFHFSTQAGISSSSGVRSCRELGISRVVLARELSEDEIRAASAENDVETEVFVQGALCFSCSGRCLLSSWGGGRSGNRGACTSPCRVAWKDVSGNEDRPMSMHDLCLVDWIGKLEEMGVASLKIEGRLKTAAWVSRAVGLYRAAIDESMDVDKLRSEAVSLGDYTGRELTDGYICGKREGMTGESRRAASSVGNALPGCSAPSAPFFTLRVEEDDKGGTLLHFESPSANGSHRIPPQRIANAKRAVTVNDMLDAVMKTASDMKCSREIIEPEAGLREKMLPRNAVNQAVDAAAAFLRSALREDDGLPRGVALPPEIDAMLKAVPAPCRENCRTFRDADRVRVNWDDICRIPSGMTPIVCCYPETDDEADRQAEAVMSLEGALAALPYVMYEHQLAPIGRLVERLAAAGTVFEVNSWDGWQLLRERVPGARFEAGPGLGVLNAIAAAELVSLGAECVSIALEIDRPQLECLCAAAEVPLAMTVYSRPPLMMTRAVMPGEYGQRPFVDARGIELVPYKEGPLTVLRPSRPYDWRRQRNEAVRAAHVVIDGRGGLPERTASGESDFLFNYDRTLR